MEKFNFITIGYDCSPAATLKNLNLRNFALPFDWVVSNVFSLIKCLEENFKDYHTDLRYHDEARLIDSYGFIYPHDYPTTTIHLLTKDIEDDIMYHQAPIDSQWKDLYLSNKQKYERRTERFLSIILDKTKPIIVLCRYSNTDMNRIKQFMIQFYGREDFYFINSCQEELITSKTISINTEKNGKWNDERIWKNALNYIYEHYFK